MNINDIVIYHQSGSKYHWLMKITHKDFKRCTGDILPHTYYSGRKVLLENISNKLIPNTDIRTGLSNTRSKNLSRINNEYINLEELFENGDNKGYRVSSDDNSSVIQIYNKTTLETIKEVPAIICQIGSKEKISQAYKKINEERNL